MKLLINFKHLEHTPALDERIRLKTRQLEKYLEATSEIAWTCCAKEREGVHCSELTVSGPMYRYHSTGLSDNLYKTFDIAIQKMQRQLEKRKSKVKNRLHRQRTEVRYLDPEAAWEDHADVEEEDVLEKTG